MKRNTTILVLVAFALILFFGWTYPAQARTKADGPGEGADKTLSPYFFVKSDDPSVDRLPLKATRASVNIVGVIADVTVTQVYKNEGRKAVEALYVFPASTRAAVYGMKMTVGSRVVEAKIKKREEARRDYEQARDQGKSASLLEQQRPNVFQMNVANIMPGDEIKVELKYTELIVPVDKVYEFVYPTVVGPRYSNMKEGSAPASEKWVKNPYLHEGEKAPYTFDIAVDIIAGMPIRELASTSHKVKVEYAGPSTARVFLDKLEAKGGDRDYVLRYCLAGNKVESGLLLSEGGRENFFLVMMEPPKKVVTAQIPGREYIFIVDVSGSMFGFPLEISKKLLRNLIGSLRPTDKFNVLLFSGGSTLMAEESLPATADNVNRAVGVIERQHGGGGTELLPAMKRALTLKRTQGFSRSVVIVTDGYVTVEEEVFDLIRNNLGDANMFAFGIGSSVNRHIIEGMARVGMGEPFVITKPDEAPAQAERFRAMIQSPVLTGVRVTFKDFAAYDVEPIAIPDVLAERPVIVFGKWKGKAQGKIILTGLSGEGGYTRTIDVSAVAPRPANGALRYLWARHRIGLLSDYNRLRSDEKRIREVTSLGLDYSLLTAYTSFVAVDSEIRNRSGKPDVVEQPLPLPQGVSDYAVGGMRAAQAMPSPMMLKEAYAPRESNGWKAKKAADEKKERTSLVTISEVTASGSLSKEATRAVVEKNLKHFEGCRNEQTLKGKKVVISFTINADGTVGSVSISSDGLKEKQTERCLIDAVRTLSFPAAVHGNETKVTVTLLFN